MQVRARFVQETLLLTNAADQRMGQSRSAVVGIKSRGGGRKLQFSDGNFQTEEKMAAQNFTFAPKTGFSAPNFVYS